MLMNGKYQEVITELKSLRLITNILHEEIETLRNQQEDIEALREGTFGWFKENKKASDVQCSCVVSEQVTWDSKQNQSSLNDKKEYIVNLKCDLIELTEMKRSASRQHVREVITSGINLLTNKIGSLKDDISYEESTVPQWSEVAVSRRKNHSHTQHCEAKPIPVIHNRYEVLNNCCISEYANSEPMESRSLIRNCKIKSNRSTKEKQKILIIGDGHA
jgi:hypothetical protein